MKKSKIKDPVIRAQLGLSVRNNRTPEFYSSEFNNRPRTIPDKTLYYRKVKYNERDFED